MRSDAFQHTLRIQKAKKRVSLHRRMSVARVNERFGFMRITQTVPTQFSVIELMICECDDDAVFSNCHMQLAWLRFCACCVGMWCDVVCVCVSAFIERWESDPIVCLSHASTNTHTRRHIHSYRTNIVRYMVYAYQPEYYDDNDIAKVAMQLVFCVCFICWEGLRLISALSVVFEHTMRVDCLLVCTRQCLHGCVRSISDPRRAFMLSMCDRIFD